MAPRFTIFRYDDLDLEPEEVERLYDEDFQKRLEKQRVGNYGEKVRVPKASTNIVFSKTYQGIGEFFLLLKRGIACSESADFKVAKIHRFSSANVFTTVATSFST